MDQIHVIRHKVLVEGEPIREVAREMGIARNTVRRYLTDPFPVERQETSRPSRVADVVRPRLHALLESAPRWTGGKQRLTSIRLHQLLVAEGFVASPRLVRREMAEWKRRRQEVFVPLVYRPGDLAEVDFFEVLVEVGGQRQKAWMFLMRLMYSGRDFAWLYPRQDQVCFLDGHARAFAHFGGVPHRALYDNLKSAVKRVLVGSERELSDRFLAMVTHYMVEASFARPRTGHDKGGVEARGKGVRWQHLVPIPTGADLDGVSAQLLARLDANCDQRHPSDDSRTIKDRFSDEVPSMLPLPSRAFRASGAESASVSRRALVKAAGASYSVWCEWAGLDVTVYVGVNEVELVGPDRRQVRHPRQRPGGRSVDYRHYLPELARKPQAVRQVATELVRDLGSPFRELWQELVDQDGPRYACRIFAKVLEAVVELGRAVVVQRLQDAKSEKIPVLLALRPATQLQSLPLREMPPSLQDIEVVASGVKQYDALLGGAL